MSTIRFGLAGCGVIGEVHARAIASLPQTELVAVADVPAAFSAAEKLGAEYGASACADFTMMLERQDVDVVNICTPSGLHAQQAIEAMSRGKHVIVEKPMALTRRDIDGMLEAQHRAGVKLSVISQRRFEPGVRTLYRLIQRGGLGRIVLAVAHVPWWRTQGYYDSGAWRGTETLDGGVLMNQAIHVVDLLQWMVGPVEAVQGYVATVAHVMECEDTAVATLRFSNGALGTISATTGANPGSALQLEILGDGGSAVLLDGDLRVAGPAGDEPDDTGSYDPREYLHAHAAQIADVIQAVRENRSPLVDGNEGRRSVEIILAILESAVQK